MKFVVKVLRRSNSLTAPGAAVIDRPYSDRQIRKKIYAKYSRYEQSSPLDERDSAIVEVTPERKVSWGIE